MVLDVSLLKLGSILRLRALTFARCSYHGTQLLTPKTTELSGVVVAEYGLTLNWPLLYEKGTCSFGGKKNFRTYFEHYLELRGYTS